MNIAGRRSIHDKSFDMEPKTENSNAETSFDEGIDSDSDSDSDEIDDPLLSENSSERDETDFRTENKNYKSTRNRFYKERIKLLNTEFSQNSSIKKNVKFSKLSSTPKETFMQNFVEIWGIIAAVVHSFIASIVAVVHSFVASIMTDNVRQEIGKAYLLINENLPNKVKLAFNRITNNFFSWSWKLLIILTVVAVAFFVAFYFSLFSILSPSNIKPFDVTLTDELNEISLTYPNQQEYIWKYFNLGIERIIPNNYKKNIIPAIYLIIQWSDNNNAHKLIEAVGNIAAKRINNTYPLLLTSKEINLLDRGELISKYSEKLNYRHVMIVKNIEKIKPNIAQDFRYYCDEENPVVRDAAIFLIMNIEKCDDAKPSIIEGEQINAFVFVEKCLRDLWGGKDGLDDVVLNPLIIRIVNMLLQIR